MGVETEIRTPTRNVGLCPETGAYPAYPHSQGGVRTPWIALPVGLQASQIVFESAMPQGCQALTRLYMHNVLMLALIKWAHTKEEVRRSPRYNADRGLDGGL